MFRVHANFCHVVLRKGIDGLFGYSFIGAIKV